MYNLRFSFLCIAFDIQAVLIEGDSEGMTPPTELVRCKLTLFYTYWQMNEVKSHKHYHLFKHNCLCVRYFSCLHAIDSVPMFSCSPFYSSQ